MSYEGDDGITAIEISFAVPVEIGGEMERVLVEWIETIARAHQPKGCVHWLSEQGYKPQLSQADARFLGRPVDPRAPESGEPTFDHATLSYATSCRERYEGEKSEPKPDRRECVGCGGPAPCDCNEAGE